MRTLPVLDELPSGYFVEESPGGVLVLHADVFEALHESGFGPESDGSLELSELSGRKPLYKIQAGGESFLLRRFHHGGLMRWTTRDRFLDAERPFRELILSDSLRRVGIRSPQVVAARAQTSAPFGWSLDVMTRYVEGTIDLGFVLTMLQRDEVEREARGRILVALGDLIRRLHTHGCLHADLQPNNILMNRAGLEGAEIELWVIDLDRSILRDVLTDGERQANLRRLVRHVRRREKDRGAALPLADYARFFRGYDPERARWKEDWKTVLAGQTARMGFHKFGWLLERVFSDKKDPRDPRDDGEVIYPPPPS